MSEGMLKGIGVLVTRSRGQASEMVRKLEDMGAVVFHIPAIAIIPVPEPAGLPEVLSRVLSYDALIFTSSNGVEIFSDHLRAAGMSPSDLPGAVCVGPRTAAAWERAGGRTIKFPEHFSGSGIPDLLGKDLTGKSFLILRPEVVKSELGPVLAHRGAAIDEVILYRTVGNRAGGSKLEKLLDQNSIGVVTFTSPSSVHAIMGLLDDEVSIRSILCLCIGKTTATAAREAGFVNVHHPEDYTVDGMLRMLPGLFK